ncbi:cupin domain-containing protein [Maribellus sp. YY47]|uniref:cupin domain-containing protein n=1 Tax=Maribellus sp. YY47 TaxID=2929486 RepID=UPI0020012867|nr:cupin domain-containing protein [Maribellus sp. YY47]MCK3685465.1 cupin domain-containing protein [Maribellus sp. YY47]
MAVLKFDETAYEIINERVKRKIIHTENLMTVMVDFSGGPWPEADPLHNHPHEQTTFIAEGEVVFYLEGEPEQRLKAGDMVAVPPHVKHAIKLVSPTARLIDSFNPVREDFLK